MLKSKLCLVLAMLGIVAFLIGACASESPSEVKNAADARDAAVTNLRKHESQNAPSSDMEWQEEDVTPQDWVGGVFKEFTSDEWTIRVSYPVVLPENTVYQVVVSSIKLGWHWKGTVEFDGSVTEISAFKQMSKEESQRIAEEFVKNSPTFVFDGIVDTLRLTETLTARCPYCWLFIFEFDSRNAGYGDRAGQALAEVITSHRAAIAVEQLEITSAVMDEQWDMISQEMISEGDGEPEGALTVAELLENPVYDTEVTIWGEVTLLGELFCPCFELTSGGATVQVWYDLMVENDDTERPSVSVEGVSNSGTVIVTGELKREGGVHYNKGDFWASAVIVLSPSETDALENTTWVLQSYGEQGNLQTVLQGTEITAVFDSTEGQVHGSAGCNNYFGSYQIINNELSIQEIAYTEMACLEPEGVMEQEEQYLRILPTVESHEISDGKLRIFAGARVLVFKATDNGEAPIQGASVEISCDSFMESNHISLSFAPEIEVNDSLTVTLCSNPTTGFDWDEAEISNQTVLEEESREFVSPDAENIVGGAGKVIWTFKALKKGTTEVCIDYSRPWEGGEKGHWTFRMTVVVK